MRRHPGLKLGAQRFGAIGEETFATGRIGKLRATVVGQRFLGWVENLHDVAAGPEGGELLDALADGWNGREEVTEQQHFRMTGNLLLRRPALSDQRRVDVGDDRFS